MRWGRQWSVVAALFVVAMFAWGIAFYGLGFFLRELHDLRGWSRTALSWLTFCFYLTGAWLNFVVSRWLGRGRTRPVFLTGGVVLAVSLCLVGQVTSLPTLLAVYLVMAFGWSCLSLTAISTTVLWWFPDDAGMPLTVALTGASVGGIVLIPLFDALARQYDFATSVTVVAVAELAVVGALALWVIREPRASDATRDDNAHGARTVAPAATPASATAWWVVRGAPFWPLSVGLALGLLVQVGFLVHQLSILDGTVDAGAPARIVAATTAAAMLGRLAFIVLTTRVSAAAVGAGFLALQTVALLMFSGATGTAATLLWSCLFGLGVGVLVVIAPLLTRATYPDVAFTAVFPVVSIGYQLAIAAGAPVTALAEVGLGGYPETLFVLGIIDGVATCLIAANWWNTRRTAVRTALVAQPA